MASSFSNLSIETYEPLASVLDTFRKEAAQIVSDALSIPLDAAFSGVSLGKKGVDFTVAVPRYKLAGKPQELLKRIEESFKPTEYIASVSFDGIFAQFFCNTKTLNRLVLGQISDISKPTDHAPFGTYGVNSTGKDKKVVIEFSSPNIAKEFHVGHLRSTIIGAFLSNLYAANGWEVVRMNYLGDWGKQFGLLALGYARYGSEEKFALNPIRHLFDVYVAINKQVKLEQEASGTSKSATDDAAKEIFRLMEVGDRETLALWQRFRDLSVEAYAKVYDRLNVSFDVYAGESLVTTQNIDAVMERLETQNILVDKYEYENEREKYKAKGSSNAASAAEKVEQPKTGPAPGEKPARAIDLSKWNLGKPVVQKADGTTIYMVRDIAGAIQRFENLKFDKMIYVIGDQQDTHCQQFFKILELLGEPFAGRLEHVNFGKVQGMSSRTGDVKFLEQILDMAKEASFEQMKSNAEKFSSVEDPEATSDQIGMTCVKIQDMTAKRINSYAFDLKRMTSLEGDTGAYLQYAHVRLSSIARKVGSETVLREDKSTINTDLLVETKTREIVYHLATYPDAIRAAMKVSEPSTIVTYCFKLSHLISSAWETLPVKGQEQEVAQARLYLFTCARNVLASAMRLLSLTPLDRM